LFEVERIGKNVLLEYARGKGKSKEKHRVYLREAFISQIKGERWGFSLFY